MKHKVKFHLVANDMSHSELQRLIEDELRGQFSQKDRSAYIYAVYDDYFIYQQGECLYKQSYVGDDDGVELVGEPKEVVRQTTYVEKPEEDDDEDEAIEANSNPTGINQYTGKTRAAAVEAGKLKKKANSVSRPIGQADILGGISSDAAGHSRNAHKLTAKAEKTGKAEDHKQAAISHKQAHDYHSAAASSATERKEAGISKRHSDLADFHLGMHKTFKGLTSNSRTTDGHVGESDNSSEGDGVMAQLTANQRTAIISALVANGCGCWQKGDEGLLGQMADDRLIALKNEMKSETTTTNAAAAPGTEPPTEKKTLTEDEFLAQAPPRIKAIIANAEETMQTQKREIADKLVSNAVANAGIKTDDTAKIKQLDDFYMAKDLPELRMLAMQIPKAPVANNESNYGGFRRTSYGPDGTSLAQTEGAKPVVNAENDVKEMMPSPPDWVAISKENAAQRAALN